MVDEARSPIATVNGKIPSPLQDSPDGVARLDRALGGFARAPYVTAATSRQLEQNRLRDARNMIQDQLIAASNNRCNVYKTHLRRLSTNNSFALGGLATAAGAAGAIVTGGASQALSGAASALSGINAEFQKDFFNGLVTAIIIPGIDRQRADIRNDMVKKSCAGVTDYPLTLAIAEAIRYHGACSADVGIAASGQAIARTTSDSLATVMVAAQQIRKINAAFTTLTSANARRLAGGAAAADSIATARKAALDAATAALQDAKAPGAAEEIAALRARVTAATKAYDTAKAKAVRLQAEAANTGTERVDTTPLQPGANPTAWTDPTPTKPLVGDATVVADCKALDSNGK